MIAKFLVRLIVTSAWVTGMLRLVLTLYYPLAFPFMGIWACNELFLLDIPYNWRTLLASAWVTIVLNGTIPMIFYGSTHRGSPAQAPKPYRGGTRACRPASLAEGAD